MDKPNVEQIEKDVSRQEPSVQGHIDRVGIENLEIPIRIQFGSEALQLPALVTAMVSLDDKNMRGIHMSRIYLILHDLLSKKTLDLKVLKEILQELVISQNGISKKSYLKFDWKWPVKRKALKTDLMEGWRYYPVFYEARFSENEQASFVMGFHITYSSTCPCSASLARTLIQEKFKQDQPKEVFEWLGKERSISATPHAQKSLADIKIKVQEEKQSFIELINEVENVLGTPVQTAVKKADEQEFAKLNSENLMFSEDATRRIKNLLNQKSWIEDFYIHVKHFESLHPFEVACHATKQVSGGFFA